MPTLSGRRRLARSSCLANFRSPEKLRHTAVATAVHHGSMAVVEVSTNARGRQFAAALEKLRTGVQAMAGWVGEPEADGLGEALIQIREAGIDPLEAVFAKGLRRFDKSGEYKADGALSAVAWVRERCNLSGGAAAERVNVARQLETLPQIEKALAKGNVGYQHVALIARAAENVG